MCRPDQLIHDGRDASSLRSTASTCLVSAVDRDNLPQGLDGVVDETGNRAMIAGDSWKSRKTTQRRLRGSRSPTAPLAAALLHAQRRGWRGPANVRKVGQHLLRRSNAKVPPVEDWSTALLGGVSLGPPPSPLKADIIPPRTQHSDRSLDGPTLRCVIATGVLDVGGEDEVVGFLGRRLPEHGIDTIVAHSGTSVGAPGTASGRLSSALRKDGVAVADVTESSACRLIEEYRPDVISAHGAPGWWLELAARRGVPYVETIHGMHTFFDADWQAEAARSARVSRIVAVSELVRQQYVAGNASIDAQRVITVPNSVDETRVRPVDRDRAREWLGLGDEFVFLSLARHSLQKNTYGLITAFADVAARHPEAHLLVAGRPDDAAYAHQLQHLRNSLECRERIHLRDHAPWAAALLAAADAFVLNSFFEGWSLASMEALAAGVPVILSDVGGAREQVGSGRDRGYLVTNPLGDPVRVNWSTIRNALFTPQANHDELVAAMSAMIIARDHWRGQRQQALRAESAIRFHPDRALAGHAAVLRSAVAPTARAAALGTG